MYKTDHIFIPFDAEGKAFTGSGKIRVFQSIDNAAKVGFFEDCLVEYEPVVHAYWVVDDDCGGVVLTCSRCGDEYWLECENYKKPNRCSTCGAHMDLDKEVT